MTFWDIIAPLYDTFETFNKTYRQMVQKIKELTPNGMSAIELAAGTGTISIEVSRKVSHVLCTDISDSMLKIANRKAKKQKAQNIHFEKTNIFETGKQDGSFDIVIASQILHLIDEPYKACEEIRRITKDTAIINLPLLSEMTAWGGFLIGLYKLFGFRPKHDLDGESYKAFIEEMGFANCEYYLIEGTVSLGIAVWRKSDG